MQRIPRPADLNDTTQCFRRTSHRPGFGPGFLLDPPPQARDVRKSRLVLWVVLVLLLIGGGMFFGPDAQEEELVAAEVEQAAAMVRQQVKVEQALQLAGNARDRAHRISNHDTGEQP